MTAALPTPADGDVVQPAPAPVNDGYQITDKDAAQLRMTDAEYKLQTWESLGEIIRTAHPGVLTAALQQLIHPPEQERTGWKTSSGYLRI